MQAYALKAAREGKRETAGSTLIGLRRRAEAFIARILDRSASAEFLASFETLARRWLLGADALSRITLKAMMPGLPDFQGTEFWDLSLVDQTTAGRWILPSARPRSLAGDAGLAAVSAAVRDGRLKLAWTRQLLKLARLAELFTEGDYQPLGMSGPHRAHVSLSRGGR
jgi:(1->4)-alpha-D-glucan 1-alpha-D-glucosylmutase